MGSLLSSYFQHATIGPVNVEGQVTEVMGLLVAGSVPNAAIGDLVEIGETLLAEVVALRGKRALMMPFGTLDGLRAGVRLRLAGKAATVPAGDGVLGRVVDAFGRPLDGGAPPPATGRAPIRQEALAPMMRRPIRERLTLGVRALDGFVPCGIGQRLGIFAGPGVGKSSLLGMIARATAADVVVLALVGERGREVGHFVDDVLGPEGLARSVVVVATSDRPPPERVRAAYTATAIAERFRAEGKQVLLFVDSLTRFCMALREIGLAVGEPPATKGYPPSVFATLPRLLERVAPARQGGSITGLYTVLVEGDDLSDPVADASRSLLDGHIVLSRRLAEHGHFPAVDPLQSLSRVQREVASAVEIEAANRVRGWLARLDDARDLIAVGAYNPGADPQLDEALARQRAIESFLQQQSVEASTVEQTRAALLALASMSQPAEVAA